MTSEQRPDVEWWGRRLLSPCRRWSGAELAVGDGDLGNRIEPGEAVRVIVVFGPSVDGVLDVGFVLEDAEDGDGAGAVVHGV